MASEEGSSRVKRSVAFSTEFKERAVLRGSRGFGRTFSQCVLGMVREDCGGSLTNVEGLADA
jgi:hypothetical protein